MRTAYQVITVAAKSSAECAASEISASEPDRTPTTAFAIVSPPEAAIEVSATRSLSFCMPCPNAPSGGRFNRGFFQRLAVLVREPRAQLSRRRHVVDAADTLA